MNSIDIEAINSMVDLVSWAEQAGARLRKVGGRWQGSCPLHGGKNPNGFNIYENGRKWKCFTDTCGGGDGISFVQKIKSCSFIDAVNIITGGKQLSQEEIDNIKFEQAERAAVELEEQIRKAQEALDELQKTQVWLKYHENLETFDVGREWWEGRGIPSDFQDFWRLGYQPDRRIWLGADDEIHIPTATIPIFANGWQIQNVKHRLINAPDQAGKYRYEKNLHDAPIFLSDPDLLAPKTLVLVEGEIKAMVTFITLDTPGWQVIGIPSKNTSIDRIKSLTESADAIYICCDPDTGKMNESVAGELGKERCRIVDTPLKIDDLILMTGMDKSTLTSYFDQSRKI